MFETLSLWQFEDMVIEENCNGSSTSNRVNGFLHGSSSGSDGAGDGSSLRTYKRRKRGISNSSCKIIDLEKRPCTTSAQLDNKVLFLATLLLCSFCNMI